MSAKKTPAKSTVRKAEQPKAGPHSPGYKGKRAGSKKPSGFTVRGSLQEVVTMAKADQLVTALGNDSVERQVANHYLGLYLSVKPAEYRSKTNRYSHVEGLTRKGYRGDCSGKQLSTGIQGAIAALKVAFPIVMGTPQEAAYTTRTAITPLLMPQKRLQTA